MAEVAGADGQVPRRVSRVPAGLTLVAYLIAVLVVTLWPEPPDPASLSWLQRALEWAHEAGLPASVDLVVLEAVANVALFVPLGVLLPWARAVRPWTAIPAGLALSAAIELTQLAMPARFPSVQDVVMNTLGAAVGAALVLAVRAVREHRRAG